MNCRVGAGSLCPSDIFRVSWGNAIDVSLQCAHGL